MINLWQRLSLRKIAAVVAAVVMVGSGVGFGLRKAGQQGTSMQQAGTEQMAHVEQSAHHAATSMSDDAEFDQMADYAMMDSQDIYASLIAEN